MNIRVWSFLIAGAVICLVGAGCTKAQNSSPAQAIPFNGQIYRTLNDQQAITLISPDQLELREQGDNFVCSYTKQDDTLRVVATIMGTTQAFYYKIVPKGLQGSDGTILYSPDEREKVIETIQAFHERVLEQRRQEEQQIAELTEESKHSTKEIESFPFSKYIYQGTTCGTGIAKITDTSLIISFNSPDGTVGNTPAPIDLWFGLFIGITRSHHNFGDGWPCRFFAYGLDQFGGTNYNLFFDSESDMQSFANTLANAVQAFKAKYRAVKQQNYTQIQDQ